MPDFKNPFFHWEDYNSECSENISKCKMQKAEESRVNFRKKIREIF